MADVAATLAAWSSTTNSNSPAGTATVGPGVDDNFREVQGVVVRGLSHKGADIASAATTDLGAVEGLMHDITGTTTITGFGTVRAGILKVLKFEGALTLTHNSTSLILPGGANVTTADGDIAIMFSEGSGNWRCLGYLPAATAPVAATQAEQETGTTLTRVVTPGRQHFHPGHPKAWAYITVSGGTPTLAASYNVSGITDNGVGDVTITFTTAMSSANYAVACQSNDTDGTDAATLNRHCNVHTRAAASVRIKTGAPGGSATDQAQISVVVFADV